MRRWPSIGAGKGSPVPDLHGWITQQIDRREGLAKRAAQYGRNISGNDPAMVLRRCTADRRILERHRLNPDAYWADAAMCEGCGTEGEMAYPRTENLNDCPELLDLAHAHGLTPEILATLDRPQEGDRPEPRVTDLNALVRLMSARPTSSVPAGLRGPNWKAQQ